MLKGKLLFPSPFIAPDSWSNMPWYVEFEFSFSTDKKRGTKVYLKKQNTPYQRFKGMEYFVRMNFRRR